MTKPPVVVAAAVVRNGDRFLITQRRPGAALEGLWEFPGGKVEPGEDPRVAVVRECSEECAIDLRVLDVFEVSFHRYATKDVLLIFFACELTTRRDVQHLEVADHRWVLPTELSAFAFPPADEPVLRKLTRGVWPVPL